MCGCKVQRLSSVSVVDNGPDKLFVECCYSFLGVYVGGCGKYPGHVQSRFGFVGNVDCARLEWHPYVIR